MTHLDKEDIELVLRALEQRESARLHEEHQGPHTRSVRKRLCFVVVVIVALAGADHLIHLEWLVRAGEMSTAAFFDWWFNVAKAGEMNLPKVRVRRKAKAPTASEAE